MKSKKSPQGSLGHQVKLILSCPGIGKCCDKKPIYWRHEQCGTYCSIDQNGDIGCMGGCEKTFIKEAYFKCETGETYNQYRSKAQFFNSLASLLKQAVQFNENEDYSQFIQHWQENVTKRWLI